MKDVENKEETKKSKKEQDIIENKNETKENNIKENDENKKDLKKNEEGKKKENEISEEKLNKIKNEIKNNKKSSKLSDNEKSARRKALANIAMGACLILYYDLILMGACKLPTIEYLTDLKTFVVFQLIVSLLLFERAFRTSSRPLKYAGCELIVNSGMTLVIYNLFARQSSAINLYVSWFIGIIAFYYMVKSIVIIKLK